MSTPTPNPTPLPKTVTGGCLCGGVRYKIDFSPNHDWKHGPHTCQCTQCRKNSGSLIYFFHTVSSAELTFLSNETYAEYASSPGCIRCFCNKCGSPLSWYSQSVPNEIELAVGAIDEEFLLEEEKGGFAKALATLEGDHFYVKNEIGGITDAVSGKGKGNSGGTRFLRGSKEGALVE